MPDGAPRVLVAPDKFRGSLTARHAAEIIADGVHSVLPAAQCELKPIADGGEGTVDAAIAAGACRRHTTVHNPLGAPVTASWAWFADGTAIIETAQASGLDLIHPTPRTAEQASSYGTGELISAALDARATTIILGLGGSAMTDGGAGALTALGLRLLDAHGQPLPPGGGALHDITSIDTTDLDQRLSAVTLRLASDVTNPLLGTNGAAHVFSPQKGASNTDIVDHLDNALDRWCRVLRLHRAVDPNRPGAGAAGGLAFGLSAFVPQAIIEPGFDLVADLIRLDNALDASDVVITGEGSVDQQSLSGKGPIGVIDRALVRNLPTYVLAGRITVQEELRTRGVTSAFALRDSARSLEDSIQRAPALLRAAAAAATEHLRLAAKGRPDARQRQPTYGGLSDTSTEEDQVRAGSR